MKSSGVEGRELVFRPNHYGEQLLIAAAMTSPEYRRAVAARHPPDRFLVDAHRAIWRALVEATRRGLDCDPATLSRLAGDGVDIPYLAELMTARPEMPDAKSLEFHEEQLAWDHQRYQALTGPISSLIEAINAGEQPERVRALARASADSFDGWSDRRYLHDPDELTQSMAADLRLRMAGRAVYPFGLDGLDYVDPVGDPKENRHTWTRRLIPGASPGTVTVVTGVPGSGKALAIDTPIATVEGWSTMGELRVGDLVFDETGTPCRVLASSDVMEDRACLEVRFQGGERIVADAEHLWRTAVNRLGPTKVYTTREIRACLCLGERHAVRTPAPDAPTKWRHIESVVPVSSVPVRCIQVDSPSRLFLAGRSMVPTHNSTLTARLVLGLARQKRKVLYGAWEMTGRVTLELLACLSLGWSRSTLMEGKLDEAALERLVQRAREISKYVRFLANPFRRRSGEKASNERNLDLVAGYLADSACEVFVADLWKRCLARTDPDDEEEALYRQQAIAEELQLHCILVQQQRLKDIEQRLDKRPTREGVKGSGAWVEVADNMLGVHRPALWKPVPDDELEVDVLKQRFGKWPLAVSFDWDADRGMVSGGRSIAYEAPAQMSESTNPVDQKLRGGGGGKGQGRR